MDTKNQQRINQINCMTLSDLKKEATRLKVKNRAGKNRADLRQMIIDQELGRDKMVFDILGEQIDDRIRRINDMSLPDLRMLAREYKIKGRGGMKSCDLQNLILKHINNLLNQVIEGPPQLPPRLKGVKKKDVVAKKLKKDADDDIKEVIKEEVIAEIKEDEKKTKPKKKKKSKKKKKPKKDKKPKKKKEPDVSEIEKKATEFLKETAEEKDKPSPVDKLKTKIQQTVTIAVLGFNAEQEADLGDLLELLGGQQVLDQNIIFIGPDVDPIPTDVGDFKIKIDKKDRLPDLGDFELVIAAPVKRGSSTFMCDMLKKYTRPGGHLVFDIDSLKGCKSFKKKLTELEPPFADFPGFQLFEVSPQ